MRDTYISLQGLVIGFLIVILLFIPIPVIGRFICLWILFVVVCNLVSGDILFSLFISTFFVILFFLYLGPKRTISFSGNMVESFEGGEGGEDKLDTEMEITEKAPEKVPEKAPEKDLKDMNPSQLNNIVDKLNVSVGPAKDDDDDLFGKIDIGDYDDEDSDEDSDEDEDEDKMEKKVGKTTSSSKKAYKAQKQLYDLNNTANALHKTLTRMAPTLEKGQKIIDMVGKMGIEKYL